MNLVSLDLTILIEKGEDGYWVATIPEIPGAFSQGKTPKEARKNVIEALEDLMAARRELALETRRDSGIVEKLALQS